MATDECSIFDIADTFVGGAGRCRRDEVFSRYATWAKELYRLMTAVPRPTAITLVSIRVKNSWMTEEIPYYLADYNYRERFESFRGRLEELGRRAKSMGGMLSFSVKELLPPSSDYLVESLLRSGNDRLIRQIYREHLVLMVEAYVYNHDRECAEFHARTSLKFDDPKSADDLNNIGYVLLNAGDNETAKTQFERALAEAGPAPHPIAEFNLGIVALHEGILSIARSHFAKVNEMLITSDEKKPSATCLLIPQIEEGRLRMHEQWEVDIHNAACSALSVINELEQHAVVIK